MSVHTFTIESATKAINEKRMKLKVSEAKDGVKYIDFLVETEVVKDGVAKTFSHPLNIQTNATEEETITILYELVDPFDKEAYSVSKGYLKEQKYGKGKDEKTTIVGHKIIVSQNCQKLLDFFKLLEEKVWFPQTEEAIKAKKLKPCIPGNLYKDTYGEDCRLKTNKGMSKPASSSLALDFKECSAKHPIKAFQNRSLFYPILANNRIIKKVNGSVVRPTYEGKPITSYNVHKILTSGVKIYAALIMFQGTESKFGLSYSAKIADCCLEQPDVSSSATLLDNLDLLKNLGISESNTEEVKKVEEPREEPRQEQASVPIVNLPDGAASKAVSSLLDSM